MITEEKILEELKKIFDPELGIDIVTLGLIYDVSVVDTVVVVTMTFTSPFCPFADVLLQNVEDAITLLGATDVSVNVTFDPPWQAPQELRDTLGL